MSLCPADCKVQQTKHSKNNVFEEVLTVERLTPGRIRIRVREEVNGHVEKVQEEQRPPCGLWKEPTNKQLRHDRAMNAHCWRELAGFEDLGGTSQFAPLFTKFVTGSEATPRGWGFKQVFFFSRHHLTSQFTRARAGPSR